MPAILRQQVPSDETTKKMGKHQANEVSELKIVSFSKPLTMDVDMHTHTHPPADLCPTDRSSLCQPANENGPVYVTGLLDSIYL